MLALYGAVPPIRLVTGISHGELLIKFKEIDRFFLGSVYLAYFKKYLSLKCYLRFLLNRETRYPRRTCK